MWKLRLSCVLWTGVLPACRPDATPEEVEEAATAMGYGAGVCDVPLCCVASALGTGAVQRGEADPSLMSSPPQPH